MKEGREDVIGMKGFVFYLMQRPNLFSLHAFSHNKKTDTEIVNRDKSTIISIKAVCPLGKIINTFF